MVGWMVGWLFFNGTRSIMDILHQTRSMKGFQKISNEIQNSKKKLDGVSHPELKKSSKKNN